MIDEIDYLKAWEQKKQKVSSLFFDLDGTLINTDYANFLSYKKAIEQVNKTHLSMIFEPTKRITRTEVRTLAPDLSGEEYEKVIGIKEKLYRLHLSATKINKNVVDMLDKFSNKKIILVTKSSQERATLLLRYHNIIDKFTHIYCKENIMNANKFQCVLSALCISPEFVAVFENDESEVDAAILAGIPADNIFKV